MHACHSVKQDQWEGYKQLGLLFRINQSSPSLRPFPYYFKPLFHPWMELHTRHKVVSAAPIALGLNTLRHLFGILRTLAQNLGFWKSDPFYVESVQFSVKKQSTHVNIFSILSARSVHQFHSQTIRAQMAESSRSFDIGQFEFTQIVCGWGCRHQIPFL